MATNDRLEDTALVRRARQGDDDAFRVLFDRYAGSLRARVQRRLSPVLRRKTSLSDILQDAYLVAARGINEFEHRGDRSFERWLGKIVDNRTLKVIERYTGTAKRSVAREVSRGGRPDTCQFVGNGPSPSAMAIARETRVAARGALLQLRDDHREILRLVQDEGLTFKEAGARMGRSADAVRMLHSRALARFSELMKQ